MRFRTILITFCLLLPAFAPGQVQTIWERSYGSGNPGGTVFHAQESFDGGYVLAGFLRDSPVDTTVMFFIKLNSDGDSLWELTVLVDSFRLFAPDCYVSMQRVSDSDFVAVGISFVESGNDSADPVLVRVRDHGDWGELIWKKPVGNPGIDDEARALALTDDGRFVVAGTCRRDHGGFVGKDFYIALADRDGNFVADTAIRATRNDYATSIVRCFAGDDRFLIAGLCYPFDSGPHLTEADVFLVKFEVVGNGFSILEDTVVGIDYVDEEARTLAVTPDDAYVVGGMYDELRVGGQDLHLKDHLLMRLTRHLGVEWEFHYGNYYGDTTMTDNGTYLLAQPDGSFLMTGYFEVPGGHRNLALLEVDQWGRHQWHADWGDVGNDYGQCITPLGNDEYLVTGFARSSNPYPMLLGSEARPYAVKVRLVGAGMESGDPAALRGGWMNEPGGELLLYDGAGRCIGRQERGSMSIGDLAPGVYFVLPAGFDGRSTARKFVVTR